MFGVPNALRKREQHRNCVLIVCPGTRCTHAACSEFSRLLGLTLVFWDRVFTHALSSAPCLPITTNVLKPNVLKNPEPAPPPSARTAACAVACVAALLKNPEPAQPPWESGSCQLSCPTTQPWAHKAGRRAHIKYARALVSQNGCTNRCECVKVRNRCETADGRPYAPAKRCCL